MTNRESLSGAGVEQSGYQVALRLHHLVAVGHDSRRNGCEPPSASEVPAVLTHRYQRASVLLEGGSVQCVEFFFFVLTK